MADPGGPEAEVDQLTATMQEPTSSVRVANVLSGIERFTLLKKLGQGGMGTVYAAYDGLLDRKVAVKVVRADRRQATEGIVSPRDQLLREAQAMARLAHPNVVAVYEVGELGEDIYVVIELVDGTTLNEWLKERTRSWREIVAAFVQAGRGLAAAHDAGLVHRDFKPPNVLVGRDGRIQVTDFGVVSMSRSHNESPEPEVVGSAVSDITYAGRRVGTPAYMAPEQHAGDVVDGRADQFSFGIALWEALYHVRPFSGTGPALADAIRNGHIEPPPAGTPVPKFLEAIIRRALSPVADARWPSMAALIDALSYDPARARRRWLAIGAGSVGVAAIATIAVVGWMRRAPAAEPCTGIEEHLTGRWDRTRAAAVTAAFATGTAAFEATTGTRIVAELDAWSQRWLGMRVEACRATRVTGEQSEALLDARMHCLDRQLDEVDQLATALTGADRSAIARAGSLALPDVDACADREAVLARVPPRATSEGTGHVEHALAAIQTIARTGRYGDARARAKQTAADAAALGFAPLLAEAVLVRGQLEEQDGDLKAARASLAEAARLAAGARDDRTTARALVSLVGVLVASAEVPAALALAIGAAAAVARTQDRSLDAELAEQLGAAHDALGDDEAEPHLARALKIREELGRESLAVAQVLNKLAGLWLRRGRAADARTAYERALAIATAQLGDQHPAVAIARANVCFLDAEAGKLEPARACQEAVLVTLERALGAEHPQVAWALNEVALVQREQGDVAGAERRFTRALEIWERASGPQHPDVAWPLINLGEIAIARGDHARAEASCRRARAILEVHDATAAVPALTCLAEALVAHAPAEAKTVAQRAVELAKGTPDAASTAALLERITRAGARR